jgi:hypothetical protein
MSCYPSDWNQVNHLKENKYTIRAPYCNKGIKGIMIIVDVLWTSVFEIMGTLCCLSLYISLSYVCLFSIDRIATWMENFLYKIKASIINNFASDH